MATAQCDCTPLRDCTLLRVAKTGDYVMKTSLIALAALGLVLPGSAQAATTIFFGENQSPAGGVSGDPLDARTAFLAALTAGVSTEDFEALPTGAPPFALSFMGSGGTINATLTGTGSLRNSPITGTYATSGSQFYDNQFNAFTVSFASPIAAFGFYGTDIGDVNRSLEIILDMGLSSQRAFTVANTINANNASLLFWGITDTTNPFSTVTFGASGGDRFGFDDLTVGDIMQVRDPIPEPSTWAMMLLGFGAVGGVVRSRRRQTLRVAYTNA